MEKKIIIKNLIGNKFQCQDAILVKSEVLANLSNNVILDFSGIEYVPTTFFYNLFSELLYINDRKDIINHIKVENLPNIDDYNKVVYGTTSLVS